MGGGPSHYEHDYRHSSLVLYNWPAVVAVTSYYWYRLWEAEVGMDIWGGDWSSPRFQDLLPLPGGRVVTAQGKKDLGEPPDSIGFWDKNFAMINEIKIGDEITGIAFDALNATVYVATHAGLYSYGWDFAEKWNTSSTYPDFTHTIPVLTDDSGVLGCLNGVLARIEPDGSLGTQVDCGAFGRPCVLNDGTIAVITQSTIKYFDPQLNSVGEIPLPTGSDTGSLYPEPPLVDSADNMALFEGTNLYIIDRNGNLLDQRTFDVDIHKIRLGPQHLFVCLQNAIYRFGS
jgi:hypothetical protein